MSGEVFLAIKNRDMAWLAQLLRNGCDPSEPQLASTGWTPLQAAIDALEDGGKIEAVILLLRNGASVNGWDRNRRSTPLLMALFRNQVAATHLLLAAGADPNVVGDEGDSPLRWCAEHGDIEGAALLIGCGAGASIDSPGGLGGMTALGLAAQTLNLDMIRELLRGGADPEVRDLDNRTAGERLPTVPSPAREIAMDLLGGPR